MEELKGQKLTPSQFYKMRRPEYFSDSENSYDIQLPREQLAYEFSQITKNQKQDDFETFCRKLAEKFITPNIVPQVGPAGGGDGKTDFETYPVSTDISDRWFVPENGWEKDEKWAFAISAKEDWKNKVKSDVEKIVNTGRDYTRVYFMTNQFPSSKKKKETQDELIVEFKVDVVILDGEWILEKVYNSNLIELAVDSLHLSNVYKNKKVTPGQKDVNREKKLNELEEKINKPGRYFEYDYQLVEDALEAAILTRMLEKPRDEVEGKFDRASRFCNKVNSNKQWVRLRYQRAWTYVHWYDDYASFVEEFLEFKKFISEESNIYELELYLNLINITKGISAANVCDLEKFGLNIENEKNTLNQILDTITKNEDRPVAAIIAKTFKAFGGFLDANSNDEDASPFFSELSNYFNAGSNYKDYPFEKFKELITEMGDRFPDTAEYDRLIDTIASIEGRRVSEINAGKIFLKRGVQKLEAKFYKESIIYFGKAVLKLTKEESEDGMYLALRGLSDAYSSMGLLWASNACLTAAISIPARIWYQKGIIDKRIAYCARKLLSNELIIGRIPSFLSWWELLEVVSKQLDHVDPAEEKSFFDMIDGCLAVRVINTDTKKDHLFTSIPALFEQNGLWLSQNASLYKLGYTELIIDDYKSSNINNESELDQYFEMVSQQPFTHQMLHDTNFLSENEIVLSSTILGTKFNFHFKKEKELLLAAETLLAFFESFLATSLTDLFPTTEVINFKVVRNLEIQHIKFFSDQHPGEIVVEINDLNVQAGSGRDLRRVMLDLAGEVIGKNFVMEDAKLYFENLFKTEEINERLSFVLEHRRFVGFVLGKDPKIFFDDWTRERSVKEYPLKRAVPVSFQRSESRKDPDEGNAKPKLDEVRHDKRKVFSVIDTITWDQAGWKGLGFFADGSGLGICFAFEKGELGKKIFSDWIHKFGNEDKLEEIKLTIIRGVNRSNPFWYRVHISSDLDRGSMRSGDVAVSTSRIHEMNAESSYNLENLINGFKYFKQYRFCPAQFREDGQLEPFIDISIIKRSLFVKEAWQIWEHDLDAVVIRKGDTPIIPKEVKDAPVLKVLERKNHP